MITVLSDCNICLCCFKLFVGVINVFFDANYKKYHKLCLSILREFGFGIRQTMDTKISIEVGEIIDYVNTKHGEPFDPEEMSLQASANIGLGLLFSKRDPYANGMSKLCRLVNDSAEQVVELFPWLRFIPPFSSRLKGFIALNDELVEYLEQLVKDIKAGETDDCLVSRYLEKEGPNYDHEQLIFTLKDLASASIDTTAQTLRWTFVFLANNQSV